MNEYENMRRITFNTEDGKCQFIPVCECGRIVKADHEVFFDGMGQPVGHNATCKKCGRCEMIFEGYYE